MRRRLLALALAFACALSLFGCGQDAASGEGKDTFTFLSYITTESFSPTSSGTDKAVMNALHETLVAFDTDGNFAPRLAESWEESEDGMSVTFHLRDDVTFHNGDPVTADDVIYTLDAMLADARNATLLSFFGGYEKIDDYTVCIHKLAPYSNIMIPMVEYVYIIPKDYHSADPEGFNEAPIGCGPYQYVSQAEDGSVTLTAYDGYYGDAPGFKNVVVKPPLEPANAVIALETGEVDMISNLPSTQATLIERNDELTLVTTDSWSAHTILLMQEPLISDVNLRKAIFHGINRENAIKLGNEGVGTPSEELFARRVMGDYAGMLEDFVGYDEALAKEYLEASNYNGEPLTLSIFENAPLAESVQADLQALGINVELEQLDLNNYSTKMGKGELQLPLQAMGSDMTTAEDLLLVFGPSSPTYGCYMALTEEYDQLVKQFAEETDAEARRELVRQAMQIMYDEAGLVALFDATYNYAYGPDVTYDYPVSAPTFNYYLAKVMPANAE